ncbi:hypothetical protein PROVRETT_07089 [Providencia rettgeri DSM 1131]|uniref:reverse transcriptase domain-containing protein n=1 Tax=Providencia rettgeri TaxID=587 RepID=UPI000197C018|nr:hypothetical protein PROVRETT_07089 [Providencia rettgeri DSM 1131]
MMLTPTPNPISASPANSGIATPATLHAEDIARLEQAWDWVCQRRKTAPDNADIWDLRFHWTTQKAQILAQLQAGTYRLTPMQVVGKNRQVMWSAKDALALKWCALALQQTLPLHASCEHVKGHGGGRTSIQKRHLDITQHQYPWVCRTDIKGYYGNINKTRLLHQLEQHVPRHAYLNLLTQYVHYSVEDGGEFYTPESGIARGCALSPLLGAFHLWALDNYFAGQKKIAYARYMDDFIIMAKTRWSLRHQVKRLNQFFNEYGFKQHPDKTFIGKVDKGFDWLGGQFGAQGLEGISPRSQANHVERLRRLYEQTRHWGKDKQQARVAKYRKRWAIWALPKKILRSPLRDNLRRLAVLLSITAFSPAHALLQFDGPGSYSINYAPIPYKSRTISDPNVTLAKNAFGTANLCWSTSSNYLAGLAGSCASPLSYTATTITLNGNTIPSDSLYYEVSPGVVVVVRLTTARLSITWVCPTPGCAAQVQGHAGGNYATSPFSVTTPQWLTTATTNNGSYITTTFRNLMPGPAYRHLDTSNAGTSVDYTVLVSNQAQVGTYSLPALYQNTYGTVYRLSPAETVQIHPPCTVKAPSVPINFGNLMPGLSGTISASHHIASIGISCSMQQATATMTISTGTPVGTTGIEISRTGLKQGEVRLGNISSLTCSTPTTYNLNTAYPLTSTNTATGFDYTADMYAVLCGEVGSTAGIATGTATVQYNWQ